MADISFTKARLVWSLTWDADWVTAVRFLGTGRKLAAGNNLGDILLWELPDKLEGDAPKPTRKLSGHSNCISRLEATADGRWLHSASYDHTLRSWDMQAEAKGNDKIALNARAREEAVKRRSSKVPALVEVSVATQEAAAVHTGHGDWVQAFALSRDDKLLVSGDDSGVVIVRDRASGKELNRWQLKGWAYALAVSPDAKQVAVSERVPLVFDSGRKAGVNLWDRATGKPIRDLSAEFKGMYLSAAAWSADGKVLALAKGGETDSGIVFLVDPATGKKTRTLTPGHLSGATDLAFHPDGKHLASCGRDTVVRIWSVADGKLVATLGKPRGGQFKDWLHALSFSADGKLLATADMAGAVQVWSLAG
jgi:WD40 repeat protein